MARISSNDQPVHHISIGYHSRIERKFEVPDVFDACTEFLKNREFCVKCLHHEPISMRAEYVGTSSGVILAVWKRAACVLAGICSEGV
jgi:hypothetical protein